MMNKTYIAWTDGVYRLAEVAVGLLLGISSAIHLSNPYFFAESVASYGLLPGGLVLTASTIIMMMGVVLSGSLLAGVWTDCTMPITTGLFVLFVAAQVFAIATGRNIDCGCFGSSSSKIGVTSVSLSLICAIVSGVIARRRLRTAGLQACDA